MPSRFHPTSTLAGNVWLRIRAVSRSAVGARYCNRLTWSPVHVDVSESGDLAYSFGNYEFRSIGKDGKPAVEHDKYTTIWKKQKDGRWKVVLDMGNASPEPKDSGSR